MLDLYLKLDTFMKSLISSDEGAAMVEYGMLVALIGAIVVLSVDLLGAEVFVAFSDVGNELP